MKYSAHYVIINKSWARTSPVPPYLILFQRMDDPKLLDAERAAAKDDLLSGVLLNHCLIYGNLGKLIYIEAFNMGLRKTVYNRLFKYH